MVINDRALFSMIFLENSIAILFKFPRLIIFGDFIHDLEVDFLVPRLLGMN